MIGTNLAVWLNVLIQETKHEILTFYNPDNRNLSIHNRLGKSSFYFINHLLNNSLPQDTGSNYLPTAAIIQQYPWTIQPPIV